MKFTIENATIISDYMDWKYSGWYIINWIIKLFKGERYIYQHTITFEQKTGLRYVTKEPQLIKGTVFAVESGIKFVVLSVENGKVRASSVFPSKGSNIRVDGIADKKYQAFFEKNGK